MPLRSISSLCVPCSAMRPWSTTTIRSALKIYNLPEAGMKLFTEITIVQEVFDITLISAQVKTEEELIAECKMKIFIKKE